MMRSAPQRVAAAAMVFAAFTLSACSGGGGSRALTPTAPRTMSTAKVTLHWPSRAPQSNVRRLRYVSPSTQSIAIEVNTDQTLTTIVNRPSGASTSTVSIPAPVGADTFYFTTWDAPAAAGSQLGQVTVTQTIAPGAVSVINATVDGILSFIGITAAAHQPFLEQGKDGAGNVTFALVGDQPATFTIVALDADQNIIIPPGNAPTISMTSSNSAIAVSAVSGQPNQYTVRAVAPTAPGASPALQVSGSDGIGSLVQGQYGVAELAAIYVGYQGPSGASVVVYDQNGTVMQTTGSFSGIGDATGLAYDADDRRILLADHVKGVFNAFDTLGNAVSGFVSPAFAGAASVAYDSVTKLAYLTSDSGNRVGAFTPLGAPQTLAGVFTGLDVPTGIAFDSNATSPKLYVANSGVSADALPYNGDGSSGAVPTLTNASSKPTNVIYDSGADSIFSVGSAAGVPALTEFNTADGSTTAQTAAMLGNPSGVAYNPVNGEIYVTNNSSGLVTVYGDAAPLARDASVTFTPPSGQTRPAGITIVY
jgi:NHL repeat-containing protein